MYNVQYVQWLPSTQFYTRRCATYLYTPCSSCRKGKIPIVVIYQNKIHSISLEPNSHSEPSSSSSDDPLFSP